MHGAACVEDLHARTVHFVIRTDCQPCKNFGIVLQKIQYIYVMKLYTYSIFYNRIYLILLL